MKTILEDKMMTMMAHATTWAMEHNQTVGEKHDYYITLAQLERFIEGIL